MFPLWLVIAIIFYFCLAIDCENDKQLLLFWLFNYYSLNTIVSWLVNRKIIGSVSSKLPFNRKTHKHFKIQMHIRIILEVFEKYKCPGIAFFLQSSRCVSNEQPCLRATGQHDGLWFSSRLLHFFYSIFSAPISFSLCFLIFPSLFSFYDVLSRAFIKSSRKPFVYMYTCIIYIFLENMNFCLTNKIRAFWFHLFDLVWIECWFLI